jgi:hypothetical protein
MTVKLHKYLQKSPYTITSLSTANPPRYGPAYTPLRKLRYSFSKVCFPTMLMNCTISYRNSLFSEFTGNVVHLES